MEPNQIVDVTDKLKFGKRPYLKFNTSLLSIINDFVPRRFAQTETFASAGGAERHKMLITLSWIFVITVNAFSISKQDPVPRNFLVEVLEKKLTSSASEDYSPISDPSVTVSHCPENLFASCMLLPPFVTWNLTSSKNQTREGNGTVYQINGIFPDILKLGLNICCAAHEENETVVSYQHHPVHEKSGLHKAIMKDEVHLIFPVQSDDDKEYKKYFPYLKLFESPGIVLIGRQDSISRGIQNWSAALRNCWPIVVLTLLLSIVAGICVWALVRDHVCLQVSNTLCYRLQTNTSQKHGFINCNVHRLCQVMQRSPVKSNTRKPTSFRLNLRLCSNLKSNFHKIIH